MKQKNKNEVFQECYQVLQEKGNMLTGKGIVRAGSGNKKGKEIERAGYGNKIDF